MSKTTNIKEQVVLSEEVAAKAKQRAHALGISLVEYVQALVDRDIRTNENDPWLEPIPKEVDERWEKALAETEAQEELYPRPSARTADELIKLLDEEIARLPDDDGNQVSLPVQSKKS